VVDQNSVVTTWNSSIKGYQNDDVTDNDLQALANLVCQKTKVIWAFGTCFGGGMFDDLDGVNNLIQAGHSGSRYNEPIFYYNPMQQNTGPRDERQHPRRPGG